jgi:hypothetical protein
MFIVEGPSTQLQPANKKAIVTIVIGQEYQAIWQILCQANWLAYAERHNYDLIVITDFLDRSERGLGRSPAWQKLLILSQPWSAAYDRIVWVDADILMSSAAPDICESSPDPDLVGVCVSGDQMSEADKHIYFERLYKMAVQPLAAAKAWTIHEGNRLGEDGIPREGVPMLNTGVIVLNPAKHREVFLDTYALEGKSRLYEQPHLSHELFKRGLIHRLSARFNWIVQELLTLHFHGFSGDPAELELIVRFIRREQEKAYFLHFAGSMPLMRHLCALEQAARSVAPA